MHQMHIDATFGHLCIAWKIGIWKKWIKVILSKIVHCLVYVNSTEKMLNTAMTTRGGAVFVVR